MRRTKIVCTMGPNTDKKTIMRALVKNGMDVARFNFSHGDYEEQKNRMNLLKNVREELDRPVAILLDTKGPEIRTGVLEGGQKVTLKEGETFTLYIEECVGNEKGCSITYPGLAKDVKKGDKILIDDGLIERDPTRKAIIKGKTPRVKKIKYLNQFELHTLIDDLDIGEEPNWDWFILLVAKTGMRFSYF